MGKAYELRALNDTNDTNLSAIHIGAGQGCKKLCSNPKTLDDKEREEHLHMDMAQGEKVVLCPLLIERWCNSTATFYFLGHHHKWTKLPLGENARTRTQDHQVRPKAVRLSCLIVTGASTTSHYSLHS